MIFKSICGYQIYHCGYHWSWKDLKKS